MNTKILVIGACGQIGTDLTTALRALHGHNAVIAADRHPESKVSFTRYPYVQLDVTNRKALDTLVIEKKITQVYHLAAMLSASGEQSPQLAWDVNMNSLINVLETARVHKLEKVFWPSSIAVFGESAPKSYCPQECLAEPATVYGISKSAGELWCKYYHDNYGLDVRSLRYPGLISYSAAPGGGTTDFAVDIFHQALDKGSYTCFLSENTRLPMMYMPDAIRATIELMEAPADALRIRTAYNLAAFSLTPKELAAEIRTTIPSFTMECRPDFRQQIADKWPSTIDDRCAQMDWNWRPEYHMEAMAEDMLLQLQALRETAGQ